MRKITAFFVGFCCLVPALGLAEVNVKKAASVKTQKADAMDSATSLLPTVIGLVKNVKDLNAQQQQLTAECAPNSDDIRIVNDLVKEWARIDDTTASAAVNGLGTRCSFSSGSGAYETFMNVADKGETCYEVFSDSNDSDKVWKDFPRASKASVCPPNDEKNCKTVSNVYEIFDKIPFSEADYTKSEASKIAKLREKAKKCTPLKINAAKAELFGGFITETLGNVGKTSGASGTSSVIEAVSSMSGGGGIQSMLPSLGQAGAKLLDK